MNQKFSMKRLSTGFLAIMLLLLINACTIEENVTSISEPAHSYDAAVALKWNGLLIDIDRYAPGYRPPAAARLMAYTGLAAYESIVPGMPEYHSLAPNYVGLTLPSTNVELQYYWPASLNAAYASMFRSFYPHISDEDKAKIDALENNLNAQFLSEISDAVLLRSNAFGKAVAEAVFEYSKKDVYGHEAYLFPRPDNYIPPVTGQNGEKLWQPTFPDYTPALFPYWGKVKPFAMKQTDLLGKPPIPYSEDPNSKFYQQANEVRITVNTLTHDEKWIAEFWSDDFYGVTFEPAARQVAIANQLVESEQLALDRAIELYAKLGMAMCDAGISIWLTKYHYNVLRPVQFIRDVIEPGWQTALNHPYTGVKGMSPEFPAYPSGHSGFGGSAAMIFTDIFGSNYTFVDNCHKDRFEFLGMPRSFNSFLEAGMENAYSRIPLGVHYRMDCDEGLRLGYLAATRVIQMDWKK